MQSSTKTLKQGIDEVAELLSKFNFRTIHRLAFPSDEKRSIDLLITFNEGNKVAVKYSQKISSKSILFQELKRFSKLLDVNVLVIAESFNDESVLNNVLHVREKIGIISMKTLRGLVENDHVYVYEYNGMFYVRVNGEKLRDLRLRRRISLSELSRRVGVSVRALQKYENNEIDMTVEKAYRFLQIFGDEFEEALEEVNIFTDRIEKLNREDAEQSLVLKDDRDKRVAMFRKLIEQSSKAGLFNTLPSDIVLKLKNDSKIFLAYIDKSLGPEEMMAKCKSNKILAENFNGAAFSIVNDDRDRDSIIEMEKIGEVYTEKNVPQLLNEIARVMKR